MNTIKNPKYYIFSFKLSLLTKKRGSIAFTSYNCSIYEYWDQLYKIGFLDVKYKVLGYKKNKTLYSIYVFLYLTILIILQ